LLRQLTPFFAGSGNVGTEANMVRPGESNVALRTSPPWVLINGQPHRRIGLHLGTGVDLNTIPIRDLTISTS